jgi:hypothetical protein
MGLDAGNALRGSCCVAENENLLEFNVAECVIDVGRNSTPTLRSVNPGLSLWSIKSSHYNELTFCLALQM